MRAEMLVDVVISKRYEDLLADAKKICLRKMGTENVKIEFLWVEHGAALIWAKFSSRVFEHRTEVLDSNEILGELDDCRAGGSIVDE